MTTTALVMSVHICYIHVQQLGVFSCLQRVMFSLSGASHVHLGCFAQGDHQVGSVRCFIIVSLSSASQVPGGQCPVVGSVSQRKEVLDAPPPVLPLWWRRLPAMEVQVQAPHRVHDGHRLHPGQALGGQAPPAGGDHLHGQSLQD